MGKEYGVTIEGLPAVLARLEAASGANLEAAAQQGMEEWGLVVADEAKERAPYRTGKGRRSIHTRPLKDGIGVEVVVPPIDGVPYLFYQHEGTGIYGPRGSPIVPVRAKLLRFTVRTVRVSKTGNARSGSQVVYARQVRGVPPNPFLLDAFHATLREGKEALVESLATALGGKVSPGGGSA